MKGGGGGRLLGTNIKQVTFSIGLQIPNSEKFHKLIMKICISVLKTHFMSCEETEQCLGKTIQIDPVHNNFLYMWL
jgi:hypothetical protein